MEIAKTVGTLGLGAAARQRVQQRAGDFAPRRRGRPPAKDLASLEARLIAVGSQVFFEQGYGGATMTEIAAIAKVSKTTLYSRFPTKSALLGAIVEAQLARWSDYPDDPLCEPATLEDALRDYGARVLSVGMTYEFQELNRLMHAEAGRFPEVAEAARARFAMGIRQLASILRRFADRDGIACRDPEGAARRFHTLLAGWIHMVVMQLEPAGEAAEQAWLDRVVRAFVADRAQM